MQTASTNICERLCNKSMCEISLLKKYFTVSGIITKWKQVEQQQLSHKVVGHIK
ncbi:unnamed protein product [Staurois parvus]|uniref:Uncharacterized protein n=1 Tax=Staurois parvus TaxID=386267 RepID=A0ABN9GI69_9NEOB|nr:unnamed protein product [Staurois parvus]